MYCEDVELCLRARKLGCEIQVLPTAKVSHFEPAPASASEGIQYHKLKNLITVYVLHARPGALMAFVFRYIVWGALRRAVQHRREAWLMLRAAWAVCWRGRELWNERQALGEPANPNQHSVVRAL